MRSHTFTTLCINEAYQDHDKTPQNHKICSMNGKVNIGILRTVSIDWYLSCSVLWLLLGTMYWVCIPKAGLQVKRACATLLLDSIHAAEQLLCLLVFTLLLRQWCKAIESANQTGVVASENSLPDHQRALRPVPDTKRFTTKVSEPESSRHYRNESKATILALESGGCFRWSNTQKRCHENMAHGILSLRNHIEIWFVIIEWYRPTE